MKILNGTKFFGFMQILLYRFINVYNVKRKKKMLKTSCNFIKLKRMMMCDLCQSQDMPAKRH